MDELEKNQQIPQEPENTDSDTTPQPYPPEDFSAPQAPAAPVKTRTKVQKPIIIAACVLAAALVAFVCFKVFFNNSIVGTWVLASDATADEATDGGDGEQLSYYTFESDGTATITLGTMKIVGTWSYADDNTSSADQQGDAVTVSVSYFFNGTFTVDLGGNAITGRTLSMKGDNYNIDFVSTTLPDNKMEPSKDFKAVDSVVGKWNNSDYNLTYTFNKDGTCKLSQEYDTLILDGVYTVDEKKSVIEITYMEKATGKMSIEYSLGDSKDKITFSGLEYTRVTE